jgi:hypothetical protein
VDLLSPLLRGLFIELPTRAVPEFGDFSAWLDRARWLEDALAASWQRATQTSLRDLHVQDLRRGEVPHLMFLTTSVETGHRMAVGHLRLGEPPRRTAEDQATDCRPIPDPNLAAAPDSAARLWNLAEEAPGIDLPLVTAAVLSARFPMVTPAAPCLAGTTCAGASWMAATSRIPASRA